MPWILRPCPGGCGRRVPSGRCPSCERVSPRNHRGVSRHARGLGAEHDRLRPYVLARDPVCRICHERPSTTVDHIIPRSRGGRTELGNLRGACAPCNYGRR